MSAAAPVNRTACSLSLARRRTYDQGCPLSEHGIPLVLSDENNKVVSTATRRS